MKTIPPTLFIVGIYLWFWFKKRLNNFYYNEVARHILLLKIFPFFITGYDIARCKFFTEEIETKHCMFLFVTLNMFLMFCNYCILKALFAFKVDCTLHYKFLDVFLFTACSIKSYEHCKPNLDLDVKAFSNLPKGIWSYNTISTGKYFIVILCSLTQLIRHQRFGLCSVLLSSNMTLFTRYSTWIKII